MSDDDHADCLNVVMLTMRTMMKNMTMWMMKTMTMIMKVRVHVCVDDGVMISMYSSSCKRELFHLLCHLRREDLWL